MLQLDHLVILVNDLAAAVSNYEQLGFTVTPGGTHADGLTHNALITFRDGTYLELIAFVDAADPRDNQWGWRALGTKVIERGGGLIDYCAASDDLVSEVVALRERGLQVKDPTEGGRQRPDGQTLVWRSARFWQAGHELPFLIQDVTPRELRVPGGPATEHANGAIGIRQLTIAVADLDRLSESFAALTGSAVPDQETDRRLDAISADFALGPQRLRLVEPANEFSMVQQQLETIGLGPFEVTLDKLNRRATMLLDVGLTHGVRIWL